MVYCAILTAIHITGGAARAMNMLRELLAFLVANGLYLGILAWVALKDHRTSYRAARAPLLHGDNTIGPDDDLPRQD